MTIVNTNDIPTTLDNVDIFTKYLSPYLDELESKGLEEIEIMQQLIDERFSHYWYSYNVLNVKYKNSYHIIRTHGNVCMTLFNKDNNHIIKTIYTTTSNNNIYSLHEYIHSDKELEDIINEKSSRYKLDIAKSNWWEVDSHIVSKKGLRNPYPLLGVKYLKDAIIETLNILNA